MKLTNKANSVNMKINNPDNTKMDDFKKIAKKMKTDHKLAKEL
jgi:hypothetical protein